MKDDALEVEGMGDRGERRGEGRLMSALRTSHTTFPPSSHFAWV